MKLRDIFNDSQTSVFVVTDQEDEDELNWVIEPTDNLLIPVDENIYFVKAYQIDGDTILNCFLGVMTPERIAETVVKVGTFGNVVAESLYDQKFETIPAVASECYGNYELYYAKSKPQIGVDILSKGLGKAINKSVVAMDLGYILRDEGRIEEALKAFLLSEKFGPTSEYTFLEISRLYKRLDQVDKELEYQQKFKKAGL